MTKTEVRELVRAAQRARKRAYSPYYRVRVGAALRATDGSVHTGCNVENVSGSAIACAESNALAAAVVAGRRRFSAIAVVGGHDRLVYPCGVCRQKLIEFAPSLDVYVANHNGRIRHHKLSKLLPHSVKL